jgi:hypothetical protein
MREISTDSRVGFDMYRELSINAGRLRISIQLGW